MLEYRLIIQLPIDFRAKLFKSVLQPGGRRQEAAPLYSAETVLGLLPRGRRRRPRERRLSLFSVFPSPLSIFASILTGLTVALPGLSPRCFFRFPSLTRSGLTSVFSFFPAAGFSALPPVFSAAFSPDLSPLFLRRRRLRSLRELLLSSALSSLI